MIGPNDRALVEERANRACEYCLLPVEVDWIGATIDHIIPRRLEGSDDPSNLCLSCHWCNWKKGTNISSIDPFGDDAPLPLFHPRRDTWSEQFSIQESGVIEGKTAVGRATIFLLELNQKDRLNIRRSCLDLGWSP